MRHIWSVVNVGILFAWLVMPLFMMVFSIVQAVYINLNVLFVDIHSLFTKKTNSKFNYVISNLLVHRIIVIEVIEVRRKVKIEVVECQSFISHREII